MAFKKFLTATLAITLLSIPFSNVAMAAKSEAKSTQYGDSLEAVLEEDNVSKKEMEEYTEYVSSELSKQPTTYWKLGAAKTAIKFVVDNKALVPGKKLRGWVDKYGGKMMNGIDNLEVASKAGLQLAFEEAFIPKNVAKALADLVVIFIL